MRFVLDTNIIFSGIYQLDSNAGRLLLLAAEGKIELLAPDHVKIELARILDLKLSFSKDEVDDIINSLPINWIEEDIYVEKMEEASGLIAHDNDVPVLACALALNAGIISGDKHFQRVRTKKIKVWKLKKAVAELE